MTAQARDDEVFWMADCYSLAKRFPDPVGWMSLLEQVGSSQTAELSPYYYWLWMEIWKAAWSDAKPEQVAQAGQA